MTRRLRLWSGLVLFAYVAGHLINHTFGLASVETMEAGRRVFATAVDTHILTDDSGWFGSRRYGVWAENPYDRT